MSPIPEALENIPDVIEEIIERTDAFAPIIQLRNRCKEEIERVSGLLDRPLSSASSSLRRAETVAGIFRGKEEDWPQAKLVGIFLDGSTGDDDSKMSAVHPIMKLGERYFLLAGHGFKKVYGTELDEKKEHAIVRNCEPLKGQWNVSQRITKNFGWLELVVPWAEFSGIGVGVVLDEVSPHSTSDLLDVITGEALGAMYQDAHRGGPILDARIKDMEAKLSIIGKISEGLRLASE